MITMVPATITTAMLDSTSVTDATAIWSAGTYHVGNEVIEGESVYRALGTTTDQPSVSVGLPVPEWIRLGYSNIWRMFRDGSDSRSTQSGDIDVTIETDGIFSAVALLGVSGITAQVIVTDAVDGEVYNETVVLADIGASDWWEYLFTDYDTVDTVWLDDLPPYSVTDLRIIIDAGTGDASCGLVLYGQPKTMGVTVEGTRSRIEDFSRRVRDEFGNLTLVPRRTIRVVDFDFRVEAADVYPVDRRFAQLAATPLLFLGHAEMPETIVYGVYNSFQTILNGHTITECSVTVEEF